MRSNDVQRTVAETVVALATDRVRGLSTHDASERLAARGANEIPDAPRHPLRDFLRRFWGPAAWMLELIVVLSIALAKYADVVVAAALLLLNAIIGFLQEARASKALTLLRKRLQVSARVLRDASWRSVDARELVVGDVVRIRAGDFVPADLQILDGELGIDQSMLTGEALAVDRRVDDEVWSGSIVAQGEATAIVVATGTSTYFGRTAELVRTAKPKLHIDEVVGRVVRWLLLVVGVLVAITVATSVAQGSALVDIAPLALVLLMSAVPVALPVMFTVSTALGSMQLARRDVLVTRMTAIEDAANMDVLCVDKTGTLTQNRPTLTEVDPEPGFGDDDVRSFGALASSSANRDPLDLAFLEGIAATPARVISFVPFSASTRRTEAIVEDAGGRAWVSKGAVGTMLDLVGLAGAERASVEARARAHADSGARVLAVARAEHEGAWRLVGLACLRDPLRPDSRRLCDELRSLGLGIEMLTGDALPVARRVATELGLGEVARAQDLRGSEGSTRRWGGLAEVFPEDKLRVVEALQRDGHIVGMTGDGVNDAPALRQSEIGIAVSTASDVAKAAAGVVLVSEGLVGIVELVRGGRAIYQRVLTWIVNKVSRTILKSSYVAAAFLVTGELAVSALAMVLLVFMTDFVKIALATDRVRPSPMPETWNIGPLVGVAAILGVVMTLEALALLALGDRVFELSGGRLHTFAFETLLFFALFSIVSIRERRAFWRSRPSTALMLAIGGDAIVGALLGVLGIGELEGLTIAELGTVVIAAMICGLGPNDLLKTALFARALRVAARRDRAANTDQAR